MSDEEDGGGRRSRRKGKGRRGRRASQGSDDDSPDEEKGSARKPTTTDAPAVALRPSAADTKPAETKKPAESKKPESKTETKGSGGDDLTSIEAQTRLYDDVNANIDIIKENTRKLRKLDTNSADERSRAKMMKQLDQLVESSTKKSQEIKANLERIKTKNFENKSKAGNEARENLYKKHAIDFQKVFTDYKNLTEDLRKKLVDDKKRQLKTVADSVNQPLSEEKIDMIITSGQADNVIQQVMMEDNQRLYDLVADIEDRHTEVLKLERQVLEVFELFKDLAVLVEVQQENLNNIGMHITKAGQNIEKGKKNLDEALEYQRKARRRRCMILMCLMGVLVAILVPVLLTTVNKA